MSFPIFQEALSYLVTTLNHTNDSLVEYCSGILCNVSRIVARNEEYRKVTPYVSSLRTGHLLVGLRLNLRSFRQNYHKKLTPSPLVKVLTFVLSKEIVYPCFRVWINILKFYMALVLYVVHLRFYVQVTAYKLYFNTLHLPVLKSSAMLVVR